MDGHDNGLLASGTPTQRMPAPENVALATSCSLPYIEALART
jgi:hypothetical protein